LLHLAAGALAGSKDENLACSLELLGHGLEKGVGIRPFAAPRKVLRSFVLRLNAGLLTSTPDLLAKKPFVPNLSRLFYRVACPVLRQTTRRLI
jgi:hypothetical protein